MRTFVFIDASNLFYGGEKSLGWKINYKKLFKYLQNKYGAGDVLYFGGVETEDFQYDYQNSGTVPLTTLEEHLTRKLQNKGKDLNEAQLLLIGRHLQRVRFYRKLGQFGYQLFLKPVKLYEHDDGTTKRKANCDVDMTFYMMKEKDHYDRIVVLSGDGDFLPVLKYLKKIKKEVIVLGRSERTAKEIKQFAGDKFRDFQYLKNLLSM